MRGGGYSIKTNNHASVVAGSLQKKKKSDYDDSCLYLYFPPFTFSDSSRAKKKGEV